MQVERYAYRMAVALDEARRKWTLPLSFFRFDIVCRIVSAVLSHDVPQSQDKGGSAAAVAHVDRVAARLLPTISHTYAQSRRVSKFIHHELRLHPLWHNLDFWSSTFFHMVEAALLDLYRRRLQSQVVRSHK